LLFCTYFNEIARRPKFLSLKDLIQNTPRKPTWSRGTYMRRWLVAQATLTCRCYVVTYSMKISNTKCNFYARDSGFSLPCTRYLYHLGRHTYITPSSYLELLSSFKRLITEKQDSTTKAKKRYLVGLEKLAFASSQVCTVLVVVVSLFNGMWHHYKSRQPNACTR